MYLNYFINSLSGEPDKLLNSDSSTPLSRLVASLPAVRQTADVHNNNPTADIIPPIDAAIGKLIQHSIHQGAGLSKAWGSLGNWCYRWGRRAVEQRGHAGEIFSAVDIEVLRQALPKDVTDSDVAEVVAILSSHRISNDEDDGAASNMSTQMKLATPVKTAKSVSATTELIERELRAALPELLGNIEATAMLAILAVWRNAQQNVYAYYSLAAEAYFKFLHLTSAHDETTDLEAPEDRDANSRTQNEADMESSSSCSRITATLRLLRLIVKHAHGLQDVLESGLAATPTTPWMVIIPQLFARLNHHEPYVRRRVSELLCRVASASPHLIIFPTVVGSNRQRSGLELAENLSDAKALPSAGNRTAEPSNESSNDTSDASLCTSFSALLDILSEQAPDTVAQVQVLVRELKRVTLLWDELWLVGLAQVYAETAKRLAQFEVDLRRSTEMNSDSNDDVAAAASAIGDALLAERYRISLRPVVFTVERLRDITTGAQPETNNERQFQRLYGRQIDECLLALRAPFQRAAPLDAWQLFKQLYAQLQRRSHGRTAHPLQMADISPVLAQLRDTAIQMPGVDAANGGCCIRSVNNMVRILPTKTKPKKLAFHGSDGRRYTYLFKGMEDLHLDERIMQFLCIANTMMAKDSHSSSSSGGGGRDRSLYRARHYSVIPLGSRSGLISWVDGVVPIYALYKKWQLRDASHPKRDKEKAAAAASALAAGVQPQPGDAGTALRPIELYAAKLVPHLTKHNCKMTDNRKDWPLEATKQVRET